VFFFSAWVMVCVGIFMISMATPWFQEIEELPNGKLFLQVLAAPLALLGPPAALIIFW
jgi:hypothetical protein